jgi:hypothetical protein
MSAWTTYLRNKVLDHIYGATAYTAPATHYLGLSTTTPAADGTGVTEPSGNNYSRVAITNNTTKFPNASAGAKANGEEIVFPTPSGSWGTCTYWVLYDASSGGNLLNYGAINGGTGKAIGSGDAAKVAVGDLDITMS